MYISTFHISKVLEDQNFLDFLYCELDKDVSFESFRGHSRLIPICADYINNFFFDQNHVMNLLSRLQFAAWRCGSKSREEYKKFLKCFVSFVQELKVFFAVPKQQMSKIIIPHHNELVVFIKFLLQILEETQCLETDSIVSVKLSTKILETELRFLITFLGDTPISHPIETENILTDMEAMVNEVGNFLFSLLFTWNDPVMNLMMTGVLDLSISDLLSKFEQLKTKIKEHCIAVFKLPSIMTPKTRVVSLFIVDTLLDDLNNLMNHRAYTIDGVNDQIITLHEELMLLTSSIKDVVSQTKTKVEEIVMGIVDIAYEIDYVINSFPPVWYLTLRLPQFMERSRLTGIAIKEMQKNIDAGIPEAIKYPSEQVLSPPNSEEIFVGFKNEETKIVDQLVRGLKRLQVVTIFGMPGLGKTSLAKKLYNNESIVHHFDKRAWCVVSQTYQTTNMLIEILRSISHLNKEKIKKMEEESLVEELYKSLKGRRYLIVMDDIWDTEPWNDLKRYFPDDSTGSRILFTTRHKEVGVQASPNSVINKLPFMSEAECWELLQRKVFEKEHCPPELLDIGKQIATNCLGLPLAVVVIAAVLANMEKKVHLWQGIVGSLNSHIYEDSNNCIQILELSYRHLPAHLKPCFLYFGVFDAYKKIPARKLISLWIAEGLIKKEANRHPEDVAQGYLMDLIDRSLVLVVEKKSDGGVKTCNIHDLLHGMCLRIAKQQNFLKVTEKPVGERVCFLLGRRVLDLSHSDLGYYYQTEEIEPMAAMRYLAGLQIFTLVHLRYLAGPNIFSLKSIESLHKIEFLFLDNAKEVEIPDILLNMASLRILNYTGGAYFSKSSHIRATKDESFQIYNLQHISLLSVRDSKDKEILRCSPNLRRLKCQVEVFRDPCPPYLPFLSFEFLNQLESFSLKFCGPKGRDFDPNWINLPLNLQKLTLSNTSLSTEQVSVIGRLQKLEVLKLQYGSLDAKQWDTREDEFQRLKFLELNGEKIEQWNASSDHLPRLQRLVLKNCHQLEMIPFCLGDIPTLYMIEVHSCNISTVKSTMLIYEEQREMGNEELQVLISSNTHCE